MLYAFDRAVFPVDTHVGRLLARIRAYRELGLDLDPHDHKRRQALLADLIPPNLRYGLHVNLIAHGRAICHGQRPRCDQCVIRTFCATYQVAADERQADDAARSAMTERHADELAEMTDRHADELVQPRATAAEAVCKFIDDKFRRG